MHRSAGRARRSMCHVVALCVLLAGCSHRMDRDDLLHAYGGDAGAAASTERRVGETSTTTVPVHGGVGGQATSTSPTATRQRESSARDQKKAGQRQDDTARTCETPGATDPLRIGSVGNYSGPAGSSLSAVPRSLQTWAEWVNQRGGVCGRRVQIIVVNDHSDPAQYRAALQDLVENRGVIAFTNAASLTGHAGVTYLEQAKVPAIGGGCSLAVEFNSPMYFYTCPRPDALYFGAARNAVLYGPASRRLGLVTCREVETCGSAARRALVDNGGAEQAGAELVYQTESSVAQPDYTAECRGAQTAGADVVTVMLDAASVRRFGQSCARQGYEPVYSQISSTVTPETKDMPGLGNLLVALPFFPFSAAATPAQQEFQQAMDELAGREPGPGETVGWTAGKLFELAATKAAATSGSITPATLIAALHTLRDETLGGLSIPVTYQPGKPGSYPPCWFGAKAAGGQWSLLNDGNPICRE